ncbi:hypothetical protein [Nocardiopsis sp. LOL_012]|uniref:hypothetical protein n=1 Tax=Nocardiopsis sp. LOL_012 TaxID=3345409 RepID=UPI003A861A05
MNHVCDIAELSTLADLTAWARGHGAGLRYLGPDLEGRAVYAATRGHLTRVAVTDRPDPHRPPLVWTSPLEHLGKERAT